jgi:hypothetical protein
MGTCPLFTGTARLWHAGVTKKPAGGRAFEGLKT